MEFYQCIVIIPTILFLCHSQAVCKILAAADPVRTHVEYNTATMKQKLGKAYTTAAAEKVTGPGKRAVWIWAGPKRVDTVLLVDGEK